MPLRPGHLLRDLVLEFYLSIHLYLSIYLIGSDRMLKSGQGRANAGTWLIALVL